MNTYNVDVIQKVKVVYSVVASLRTAVNETLRHENVKPPVAISLLLTDDDQLQQLNKQYRGMNEPTDVLSFSPEQPVIGDQGVPYLGDIAISIPMARRQAAQGGHPLKDELLLLAVHGTLHLLGFDHEEPEQKKVMWWTQNSILAQLGAGITSPE